MKTSINYAFALLAALGGLGAALLLHPVVGNAVVLVFVVAVIGTALYAGLKPGLACTFFSLLLIDYFLLLPTYTLLIVAEADLALLALFVIVTALTSWMVERVRNARAIAEESAAKAAALAALLERQLGEADRDIEYLTNRHRLTPTKP